MPRCCWRTRGERRSLRAQRSAPPPPASALRHVHVRHDRACVHTALISVKPAGCRRSPAMATSRPSSRTPINRPSVWVRARNGPGRVSAVSARISGASTSPRSRRDGSLPPGARREAIICTLRSRHRHCDAVGRQDRRRLHLDKPAARRQQARQREGGFRRAIVSCGERADIEGKPARPGIADRQMRLPGGERAPDGIVERMGKGKAQGKIIKIGAARGRAGSEEKIGLRSRSIKRPCDRIGLRRPLWPRQRPISAAPSTGS